MEVPLQGEVVSPPGFGVNEGWELGQLVLGEGRREFVKPLLCDVLSRERLFDCDFWFGFIEQVQRDIVGLGLSDQHVVDLGMAIDSY